MWDLYLKNYFSWICTAYMTLDAFPSFRKLRSRLRERDPHTNRYLFHYAHTSSRHFLETPVHVCRFDMYISTVMFIPFQVTHIAFNYNTNKVIVGWCNHPTVWHTYQCFCHHTFATIHIMPYKTSRSSRKDWKTFTLISFLFIHPSSEWRKIHRNVDISLSLFNRSPRYKLQTGSLKRFANLT